MKALRACFLFICVMLVPPVASGQENCDQPASHKFTEFEFKETERIDDKLAEVRTKLNEENSAEAAVVYAYGGRHSTLLQNSKMVEAIKRAFSVKAGEYNPRISILDGGFRDLPTVEVYIRPLPCSAWPSAVSTVPVDEVVFEDVPGGQPEELSQTEMEKLAGEHPKTKCPPAARAVRACTGETTSEVFVVVDSKGALKYSRSIGTHPLLKRAAEEAVKTWKFRIFRRGDKALNYSGKVRVFYLEPEEILDY